MSFNYVEDILGFDFYHDNTKQGECYKCGAKIYGSPDSQCPKCGFVNNPIETQVETPTVDRMLKNFERMWNSTADECIRRAEELEGAAMDLRERAQKLREATDLTKDVKDVVFFEINARNRAMSLALVNPKEG